MKNYQIIHSVQLEDAPEFNVSGTGDEWREHIGKPAAPNSRMVLAISTAFAATLLNPLKMEPGGIHIFGESSSGKSTAQQAGASVVGSPEIVRSWNTTNAAAEAMAAIHNDGPLFLDELGQSSAESAGSLAYSLTSGVGKRRADQRGELREAHKFTVLLFSSGE